MWRESNRTANWKYNLVLSRTIHGLGPLARYEAELFLKVLIFLYIIWVGLLGRELGPSQGLYLHSYF